MNAWLNYYLAIGYDRSYLDQVAFRRKHNKYMANLALSAIEHSLTHFSLPMTPQPDTYYEYRKEDWT